MTDKYRMLHLAGFPCLLPVSGCLKISCVGIEDAEWARRVAGIHEISFNSPDDAGGYRVVISFDAAMRPVASRAIDSFADACILLKETQGEIQGFLNGYLGEVGAQQSAPHQGPHFLAFLAKAATRDDEDCDHCAADRAREDAPPGAPPAGPGAGPGGDRP